jgi:hypothetical protein
MLGGELPTNGQRRTLLHWLLVFAIVVISCDVSTLVAPAPPVPTLGPGGINTIVAQTAGAAATQTAALMPPTLTPSATATASRTPTVTPSLTPTFIFVLATLSKTPTAGPSSGGLSCSLVSQSPDDGATMSKNQAFTVSWKVKNTGSSTWSSNAVDFIYLSGTKMASVKIADLPKSVAAGDSITLKLDMTAPGSRGSYKTVWTLRQGKNEFCRLNISIVIP